MTIFRAQTDFNGEKYAKDWQLANNRNILVANVFNATKCYMAYGKRVHYDIRGPYANHPIVSSRMSINYGRITC